MHRLHYHKLMGNIKEYEGKKYLMINDDMLGKVLDKIKETIVNVKFDDTKILIDTDDLMARFSDVLRYFFVGLVHTWNPQRCYHGWHSVEKYSKFVPLGTLKMHSLVPSIFKFLCKHFPNYLTLH